MQHNQRSCDKHYPDRLMHVKFIAIWSWHSRPTQYLCSSMGLWTAHKIKVLNVHTPKQRHLSLDNFAKVHTNTSNPKIHFLSQFHKQWRSDWPYHTVDMVGGSQHLVQTGWTKRYRHRGIKHQMCTNHAHCSWRLCRVFANIVQTGHHFSTLCYVSFFKKLLN